MQKKAMTDEYGRVFINPNYRFQSVEIGEPLSDLVGKIVILGASAAGIANLVATLSGAQHPRQLQTNLLEILLSSDSVSIPNLSTIVGLVSFLVLALAFIFLSRFDSL
jgi:hypothetical protein